MLSAADKQRYARHLLLSEIGEQGQARMCAARVSLDPSADARALEVARTYLERAGIDVVEASHASGSSAPLPSPQQVRELAGEVWLEQAAAALLGARAAAQAIKAELGLGTAGTELAETVRSLATERSA